MCLILLNFRTLLNGRPNAENLRIYFCANPKMRSVLDLGDEGFLVVDWQYRILSANKSFCTMLDRFEDQILGRTCHDFNNILSSVIGYTEIALDYELPQDAPARGSLENVLMAALRTPIKMIFWPNLCVGGEVQVLGIL